MTYMNESGLVLHKLKKMVPFDYARMLVIYDDIDLPLGDIRIRERGSAGTHKGMKSIIQHSGTQEFPRLRIGIKNPGRQAANIVHYVLTAFPRREKRAFQNGDPAGRRCGAGHPGNGYSKHHEYIQQEKELLASSRMKRLKHP